MLALTLKVLS